MIEPAAYGAAVSFGPNTQNFKEVVSLLLGNEAAVVINTGAELTAFVQRCLEQPDWADERGRCARQLVLAQRGAINRTVGLLATLFTSEREIQQRPSAA